MRAKYQSIAKVSGERCANNACLGSHYCWAHMDKKEPIILSIITGLALMALGYCIQVIWAKCTTSPEERKMQTLIADNNDLKLRVDELIASNSDLQQKNGSLLEELQSLKRQMIDVQTLSTLMPGNKPDPDITTQAKPPAGAIKLWLGPCLAWWSPTISHTYSIVTINNEPVLTLALDANGLSLSGKIRRPKDGKEVVSLIDNKYIRNRRTSIVPQRLSDQEIIVLDESGERLLYVNYLNEKAIAIEGTFYDSQGSRILTMNDSGIVDMANNHLMPGASLGGNENLFTYWTVPQRQLVVRVTQPTPINSDMFKGRIGFTYNGTPLENPSRATIFVTNTGTEPVRLGVDGTVLVAVRGEVLYLETSPPMEASDYIELIGGALSLANMTIKPNGSRAINVLMRGGGECQVLEARLREGKIAVE